MKEKTELNEIGLNMVLREGIDDKGSVSSTRTN